MDDNQDFVIQASEAPKIDKIAGPPFFSDVLAIIEAHNAAATANDPAKAQLNQANSIAWLTEALVRFQVLNVENDDPEVRNVILGMLGHLGMIDPKILIRATRDPVPHVRATAALALANHPRKRSVSALLKCFQDEEGDVRGAATLAAGEMGAREAVPALLDMLGDAYPENRILALGALGDIGDERAIVRLREQLRDPNPEISVRAHQALRKIAASARDASRTQSSN